MALGAQPIRSQNQPPHRWKWSIDDLRRFDELGLLPPEHRFELMDGEVVDLMGASPRHDGLISALAALFSALFAGIQHVVREEKTLLLTEYFAPLPDIVVVTGSYEDYLVRYPSAKDVLLVVELADSSLEYDRSMKLEAYANAGIQDYWIVNLRQDQIEIFRQPVGGAYLVTQVARVGETISPLTAPSSSIDVARLLGR